MHAVLDREGTSEAIQETTTSTHIKMYHSIGISRTTEIQHPNQSLTRNDLLIHSALGAALKACVQHEFCCELQREMGSSQLAHGKPPKEQRICNWF